MSTGGANDLATRIGRRLCKLSVVLASEERVDATDASRARVVVAIDPVADDWFVVHVDVANDPTERRGNHEDLEARIVRASAHLHRGRRVAMVSYQSTIFDADRIRQDPLGIGRCRPEELPGWLAGLATKLGCTWEPVEIVAEGIDDDVRARIANWFSTISP